MVTIYDLLEVNENASKDEITDAYQKLVYEYRQDPSFSAEENKENEMLLNKIKMAYDILIDDAKRARYDKDLANKRAEALLSSVSVNREELKQEVPASEKVVEEVKTTVEEVKKPEYSYDNEIDHDDVKFESQIRREEKAREEEARRIAEESQRKEQPKVSKTVTKEVNKILNESGLTEKEEELLKKAAQEEFKQNLRRAEQAEETYKKAYNEAYNEYMKKNKPKNPTIEKIKRITILVVAILITAALAWIIPPSRNLLIELYETNDLVRIFANLIGAIFSAIFSVFK